jgi:hypothetical protein
VITCRREGAFAMPRFQLIHPSQFLFASAACRFAEKPAAVERFHAAPAGRDSIRLKWRDRSRNEDGFRIQMKVNGGAFRELATTKQNVRRFIHRPVRSGVLYTYRIYAFNEEGKSQPRTDSLLFLPRGADSEPSPSPTGNQTVAARVIAKGVLNRLLAQQATPMIRQEALKPYSAYSVKYNPYLEPAWRGTEYAPIYGLAFTPDAALLHDFGDPKYNYLVGVSSGSGRRAYSARAWAYQRLEMDPFLPVRAPEWIDYYDESRGSDANIPAAEIAYTIWDESGKIDINMAGADPVINGMAPHDLEFERFSTDPAGLLAYLNNGDPSSKLRDRNNFSYRRITEDERNDTGNDRSVSSIRELLDRGLAEPDAALPLTCFSRDFDVRPEWDGSRESGDAERFLRSFVNNPRLFKLFLQPQASAALIRDTLDENALTIAIPASLRSGEFNLEDSMQMMRLLAVLRRSLPPYRKSPAPVPSATWWTQAKNTWYDEDVWGIAVNIVQATVPPSDHNLLAYNRAAYGTQPFWDPNARFGIRASPYITETAFRLRQQVGGYDVTEFIEIWNPYAIKMKRPGGADILYRVGEFSGVPWRPVSPFEPEWTAPRMDAIYGMNDAFPRNAGRNRREKVAAPLPGEFKVVQLDPLFIPAGDMARFVGAYRGFGMRSRAFIQDMDYYPNWLTGSQQFETVYFSTMISSIYNGPGGSNRVGDGANKYAYMGLPSGEGEEKWFSFQIDDPRMGGFPRVVGMAGVDNGFFVGAPSGPPGPDQTGENLNYTWKGYPDQHSLWDTRTGQVGGPYNGKSFLVTDSLGSNRIVAGFNRNFGENFPGAPTSGGIPSGAAGQAMFERAMATFALPCRPFFNIGELGTVFANRPWRTLTFGKTIAPLESTVPAASSESAGRFTPMAFLDYFTTIGVRAGGSDSVFSLRRLNFAKPNMSPTTYTAVLDEVNFSKRLQNKRWLFESVDRSPDGEELNLRPVRGRINLNSASEEVLVALLKARYRMPNSIGLQSMNAQETGNDEAMSEVLVRVEEKYAEQLARRIIALRPFRTLSDLAKLDDGQDQAIRSLHEALPDSVVDAMIGRLAQFGTVRQQIYTIDMIVRTLDPEVERARLAGHTTARVPTAEVRLIARVYLDTFTRQTVVESVEYR